MANDELTPETATQPRQRLLEAALVEFADHGFDATSTRDICKRAGMNVAAINYYFRDKEALYVEAVKLAHTCSSQPIPEVPPGTPPKTQLVQFIRGMAAQMHTPTSLAAMQLMMREMAHPGKAGHVIVDEFIRPMAFRLRDILAALLPDVSESRRLMIGFSVIGQLLFYRQNRPVCELIFGKDAVNALTVDMVTEHVTAFTLAALKGVR